MSRLLLRSALRASGTRHLALAAGGATCVALLYQREDRHGREQALCETAAAPPLLQQQESAIPRLFCWGRLAPASSTDSEVRWREKTPVDISFWAAQGLRIKQMSYGAAHGVVLDDRGGLWAWGEETGPLPIKLPCRASVSSLASTQRNLYAVTSSGGVLEWRDLDHSIAASGKKAVEPRALGGALARASAAALAAGDAHIVVVTSAGELVSMGDNSHGQLGLGLSAAELPRSDEPRLLPAALPAKATSAACGGAHSVAVLKDGSCVSFGDDRNLQLGLREVCPQWCR